MIDIICSWIHENFDDIMIIKHDDPVTSEGFLKVRLGAIRELSIAITANYCITSNCASMILYYDSPSFFDVLKLIIIKHLFI